MTASARPGPADVAQSPQQWQAIRRFQREHRGQLARQAAALYPDAPRVEGTVLLTRPEWTPAEPVPLPEVTLHPVADRGTGPASTGLAAAAACLMPRLDTGHRAETYAEALAAIERPQLLQNRPTYRLVAADLTASPPAISLGTGTYFDILNIGEAAAHEYTAHHHAGTGPQLADLPLRQRIGDPTDPTRRPILPAITTLTIRYDHHTHHARFLIHWRDPAKVATNGGAYQLAPVGIFQPASAAGERWLVDLDPWRCMIREYSEELLGTPETDHITYEHWPLYRDLEHARTQGTCRPYLLGIGIDPLTLATDLLTAVVFDAAVFDHIFADLVADNDEGRIQTHGPHALLGTPFTNDQVHRLVTMADIQPAGAATLHLAWHLRHTLLPTR